jgi:hypothetical protein
MSADRLPYKCRSPFASDAHATVREFVTSVAPCGDLKRGGCWTSHTGTDVGCGEPRGDDTGGEHQLSTEGRNSGDYRTHRFLRAAAEHRGAPGAKTSGSPTTPTRG